MKQILLLILITLITSTAIAQWQLQAEYPEGTKNFKEIFFLDENYGWIADETGPYLFTINGGEKWIENPLGEIAHDVVFTSRDTGFICYDHYIKKTINGGIDWYEVWGKWAYITDLSFADPQHAWAVWSDDLGVIPYTTVSGENWEYTFTFPDMLQMEIYTLDLVAPDTGWVYMWRIDSDYNEFWEIYKTENGGDSWILKNPTPGIYLREDIFFINDSTGWFTGGSSFGYELLYTENNGETWQNQELTEGENITSIFCIQFLNDTLGWLGTANENQGCIYTTQNSGDTWIKQAEYDKPMLDLFMLNKNKGWAIGKNMIYKYTGSNPVQEISKNDYPVTIFPNPSKGIFTLSSDISLKYAEFSITDFTGRILNTQCIIKNDQLKIDLSKHPPGIYFITISTEEQTITKKIIKI
jgi:photosystem II stability/assembly factor-like uncharacterized protein